MRESVIYQEIEAEAIQRGLQQGERSLIIRQLNRQVGSLSAEMLTQIEALALAKLDELGEALLRFSSLDDLVSWLQANQ
jgi:predicted transposase YdaD